jgi:hypothetical protein
MVNEEHPYTEIQQENHVIRVFDSTVPEELLKWHWDEEDRTVEAIEPTDWEFQFDNELPTKFDKPLFIPAGLFHRVIKGTGDLKVKIIKHK